MKNRNDSQALRRSVRTMSWWVSIVGIGLLAADGPAATWYVAANGNDTRNGTGGWDQAYATISNAVKKAASSGDTVWVSNGVYTLTAEIYIDKSLLVRSWNNGNYDRTNTIINGNWPTTTNRCFRLWDVGASIAGFTITNGCSGAASGGGIKIYKGIVSNCSITGNQCFYTNNAPYVGGGGIYVSSEGACWARIYDSDIYGNIASNNGGGLLVGNGTTIVVNCTIRNNTAKDGGGFHTYLDSTGVPLVLSNSFVLSNIARNNGGGGVFTKVMAYNSVIQSNTALGSGGGLMASGWMGSSFYSCLIADNRANTNSAWSPTGGGIRVDNVTWGGSLNLYNCTVSGNEAYQGGGIYIGSHPAADSFYNTIIRGNKSYFADGSSNLFFKSTQTGTFYNCCLGGTNFPGLPRSAWCVVTNCIDQDPRMIDLPGGNYRLQKGSACINAGLNQEWMTNAVDLDGQPRSIPVNGGVVDIGAYEWIPQGGAMFIY